MKMNKTRLLEKISVQSGISADECSAVLKTFERVLSEELTRKYIVMAGGYFCWLLCWYPQWLLVRHRREKDGRYRQSGEWLLTGIQNTRYRMQR